MGLSQLQELQELMAYIFHGLGQGLFFVLYKTLSLLPKYYD
jgi:hypothetical protein